MCSILLTPWMFLFLSLSNGRRGMVVMECCSMRAMVVDHTPSHGVFSVDLPCGAADYRDGDQFALTLSPDALQPFEFSAADDQHATLQKRDEGEAEGDVFDRLLAAQYEVMAFRAAEVCSCERSAVSERCAEFNG